MNLVKHQIFTALAALGWIGFAGWLVCSTGSGSLFRASFARSESAIFTPLTLPPAQKQGAEEAQRKIDAFMAEERRAADQHQHSVDAEDDEPANANTSSSNAPNTSH